MSTMTKLQLVPAREPRLCLFQICMEVFRAALNFAVRQPDVDSDRSLCKQNNTYIIPDDNRLGTKPESSLEG